MRHHAFRTMLLLCLALAGPAGSQAPAPAPTCDSLLSEQYRQLVTDQVLAAAPASQPAEMPQQLGAIIAQLRIVTMQYYKKLQQALEAEGQVASRDEQIRQLRQQVQMLSAELAEMKQAK